LPCATRCTGSSAARPSAPTQPHATRHPAPHRPGTGRKRANVDHGRRLGRDAQLSSQTRPDQEQQAAERVGSMTARPGVSGRSPRRQRLSTLICWSGRSTAAQLRPIAVASRTWAKPRERRPESGVRRPRNRPGQRRHRRSSCRGCALSRVWEPCIADACYASVDKPGRSAPSEARRVPGAPLTATR
jgi:hypothetical protein